MKVTICQIDPRAGHLDACIAGLREHVNTQESDFVLLPEMGFSEWLAADRDATEERWMQAVENHQRQIDNLEILGVNAVIGSRPIVNDQGSRRNQAYLWTRDTNQAIGIHEKYYLPDEEGYWEATWYDRGEKKFDAVNVGDVRIGVQICTEIWFLEWARYFAKENVDMLCVPRATSHYSLDKWLAGGRASAICSGSYGLSSNLWCPPGEKANCGGMGWMVDPEGNVLATTSVDEPFVTVEIDLEFSRKSKSTYPRYVLE